jgi:transcriptional regulator with XRE-family HTH domain
VDIGIGATLREARNRRKLDLSEVEQAIKIRVRYLRAIENEDWDVLPGGAYTRAFIRTYAVYLGLDGDRLADEYRRVTAPPLGERAPQRVEPVPSGARPRGPLLPGRVIAALAVVALVAVLVAIGLLSGHGGNSSTPSGTKRGKKEGKAKKRANVAAKPGVGVLLTATGEVWVCVLDDAEEPLVNGAILEAGEEAGPFRSRSFTIALGNGEANLSIDGKEVDTPPSNSPVGYAIHSSGKLTPLEEGERPSCE